MDGDHIIVVVLEGKHKKSSLYNFGCTMRRSAMSGFFVNPKASYALHSVFLASH
jgi:hypothetical protein